MRRMILFLLLLCGCTGIQEARKPTWYKEQPVLPKRKPKKTKPLLQPEMTHRDRPAANAWEKILLRHTRAIQPDQVKVMVEQDIIAPAGKNILLVEDHKFIFVLSCRRNIDAEIEIRVVNRDTGELLSSPGHKTKLGKIRGTTFVDVPIRRVTIIGAGKTLPISIQIKPIKLEGPVEVGVALVMIESENQLIRVTELSEGNTQW